jgi:hypothetical protein
VPIISGGSGSGGGGLVRLFDTTLGASAPNIDLTPIPAGYANLLAYYCLRTDRAALNDNVIARLNGDSGANYFTQAANATAAANAAGEGLATGSPVLGLAAAATAPANRFGTGAILLPNYAGTSHKTAIVPAHLSWGVGTGTEFIQIAGVTWANVAAVTQLTLSPSTGPNFVAGSRVTLYGLL